ncbi:tetratricopeptide repeat protein [Magnetospira sp. QH-2]|uniref:tetratricopeptide repeat protein n=1 Tax=Magnetospira sp. (strain QH-2) TaxID=1288970 RepID=UPI0003E80F4A|nr:tetratricopeptide repeat protein [Magnetospira sp. QH-2]CCQ74789.1 conserved exported protein of unknown function with Sel1 repeats [Magnetospira sp. QH-2]
MLAFMGMLLVWPLPPAQADFAAGMTAYEAKDYATAHGEWLPLAEAGEPRAQYWLADLYRFGTGVEQDYKAAIEWYKKAARQTGDGDTMRRAVYALGYMVKRGQGTPRNMDKAECLYRVSAENGYANAQAALHVHLRNKPGIDPTALDWAYRAAAQGNKRSLFIIGNLDLINPYVENSIGYMRLFLSAKKGAQDARTMIEEARNSTNPEVRISFAEGRSLARGWQPEFERVPEPPILTPEHCWP